MTILFFLLFNPLTLLMLCSTFILRKDLKYYKPVYKSLPFKNFLLIKDMVIDYDTVTKTTGNFSWFINQGDFILDKGFLHSAPYTYFCPYSLYWLIKYNRWVKKNLNLLKIKQFTDETFRLQNN